MVVKLSVCLLTRCAVSNASTHLPKPKQCMVGWNRTLLSLCLRLLLCYLMFGKGVAWDKRMRMGEGWKMIYTSYLFVCRPNRECDNRELAVAHYYGCYGSCICHHFPAHLRHQDLCPLPPWPHCQIRYMRRLLLDLIYKKSVVSNSECGLMLALLSVQALSSVTAHKLKAMGKLLSSVLLAFSLLTFWKK